MWPAIEHILTIEPSFRLIIAGRNFCIIHIWPGKKIIFTKCFYFFMPLYTLVFYFLLLLHLFYWFCETMLRGRIYFNILYISFPLHQNDYYHITNITHSIIGQNKKKVPFRGGKNLLNFEKQPHCMLQWINQRFLKFFRMK